MGESLRVCHVGARVVLTTMFLTACGGGGGGQAAPPSPTPSGSLVADAGPDQSGTDAQQIVVTGSATGTASAGAKYSWRQISGTTGKLDSPNAKSAMFFAPALLRDESFGLELTVTSADGGVVSRDTVTLNVAASPIKHPIDFRVPDYLAGRYGEEVVLDGSAIPGAVTFQWRASPSFEPVALNNANQAKASFKVPDPPSSVAAGFFSLEVSDQQLQKAEGSTYVLFLPKNSGLESDFEASGLRVVSPITKQGNNGFRNFPNYSLTNYPYIRTTGIALNTGNSTLSNLVVSVRLKPSATESQNVISIDQFNLPSIASGEVLDIASVKRESAIPSTVSGLYLLDFCVTGGSKTKCSGTGPLPLKISNGQLICAEDVLEEAWVGAVAPNYSSSSAGFALCNDAVDQFSLTMEAGKNYRIRVAAATSLVSKGTAPLSFELQGANGQIVARGKSFENDIGLAVQTLDYKPAESAVYKLRVSKPESFSENVEYSINFRQIDESVPNLVAATTAHLIDGGRTLVFDITYGNNGASDFSGEVSRYIRIDGPADMASRPDTDYASIFGSSYAFSMALPAGSQKRFRVKADISQLGLPRGNYYVRSGSGFPGSSFSGGDAFTLTSGSDIATIAVQ